MYLYKIDASLLGLETKFKRIYFVIVYVDSNIVLQTTCNKNLFLFRTTEITALEACS